jgi:Icc-related predicted phosphoesterase
MTRLLAVSDWRTQAISDLHLILETVEPTPDLLVYAGDDLTRFENTNDGTNQLDELARKTTWEQALVVRGNDDLPSHLSNIGSEYVTDLNLGVYEKDQIAFLGQEGATIPPGLNIYSETEVKEHLEKQANESGGHIQILVSHTPPHGVLDIGQRHGQQHIGSTAVEEFVRQEEPLLTICGHCHQFGGMAEELAAGTVINIASHDGRRDPGNYAIIDIDTSAGSIDYRLTDTTELLGSRLTDLFQVGRRRVQQFQELGITEPEEVSENKRSELEDLPGSSPWHVDRWMAQRQAMEQDEVIVLNESKFSFLKNSDPLLLDIETDLKQGRIWLVGTYSYKKDEYRQFFDPDDELELLNELSEWLDDHQT